MSLAREPMDDLDVKIMQEAAALREHVEASAQVHLQALEHGGLVVDAEDLRIALHAASFDAFASSSHRGS